MTKKRIIECDGKCDPTETHEGDVDDFPEGWNTVSSDGSTYHFCPGCSSRMLQWGLENRSEGQLLGVSHQYIGEEFEEANIWTGVEDEDGDTVGTQSMSIQQLIDEPPRSYPKYDHEADEGWHYRLFDHLGVTIIGQHKDVPTVIIEPEEFPTEIEIRESVAGHTFDRIAVERSVDVRWIDEDEKPGE